MLLNLEAYCRVDYKEIAARQIIILNVQSEADRIMWFIYFSVVGNVEAKYAK